MSGRRRAWTIGSGLMLCGSLVFAPTWVTLTIFLVICLVPGPAREKVGE